MFKIRPTGHQNALEMTLPMVVLARRRVIWTIESRGLSCGHTDGFVESFRRQSSPELRPLR